jgi:hypothetical protein
MAAAIRASAERQAARKEADKVACAAKAIRKIAKWKDRG